MEDNEEIILVIIDLRPVDRKDAVFYGKRMKIENVSEQIDFGFVRVVEINPKKPFSAVDVFLPFRGRDILPDLDQKE